MLNNQAINDVRKVLTGKDGALYNASGKMLASMETFQTQVNITNATYQPLGDAQEHKVFTGYGVTLTFTETVIEDSSFIIELMAGLKNGQMPEWNFQGVIKGRDGTEERMIYRSCVPDGAIDLQNVAVGDLIKRAWSLVVNEPPELQSKLGI